MSRRTADRGFTLVESVVVAALVAITLLVAVSLVQERLQSARARVAADQLSVDLRLARLTAVSRRSAVDVVITAHPTNSYRLTDSRGRTRTVLMPRGVRIVSSTSPIVFRANGTVSGGASTVLETDVSRRTVERYTINTGLLGVPRIDHERTQP